MNTDSIAEFCSRVRENTGDHDLLFGLITDTHFEEKEDLRGYGANALSHLRDFAAAGRTCGARFLFHAGDLSNGNRPLAQTRREITLSTEAMRSSGLPALFAIGNHDDNTYFCRDNGPDGSHALSGIAWQHLVYPDGLPPGAVAAPGVGNCFYFDLPDWKIRLLVLNMIDLPLATGRDGKLKYFMINDHGFSKVQLEFVAHRALDLSVLPDSGKWSVLVLSHMSLGFLPNGGAMGTIFRAFQTGTRCRTGAADVKPCPFSFDGHACFPSPADPADLVHEVEADFTIQGPHELIAHLYGHEHLDIVRTGRGFLEVALLSSLCYQNSPQAPERQFGTSNEAAWNMVAIDRKQRQIKIFRYGAGHDLTLPFLPSRSRLSAESLPLPRAMSSIEIA
ncbi:metallophosphoesterase [uncultured Victivallis sp.]|uniref:metallophosphoesterase n=1 Tax=uncultured Victivallis sp. TaxID=354118 RepID=UPI0025E49983|nr:metallophosphoesterase [uncultured Victivallis sp.]